MHLPLLLVAARAIEGVGFGIVCVCGPIVIERMVAPEKQGLANGLWGIWIPIGAFCGEILSPLIYASPLGFAGVCLLFIAPAVVMSVVVLRLLGNRALGTASKQTPTSENPKQGKAIATTASVLNRNLVILLVAWLSFNLLNFAVMSYAPSYLQSTGINPALSGLVTTIPMMLSLVTCPVAGMLIDRFSCAKQVLVVALVANVVTVVALFTQQGIAVWVASIAMGLLATTTFVATLSSLPCTLLNADNYPGAVSLYMFIQVGGELLAGLLSPLVLGPGLDNWPAYAIVCAVIGTAGLICGILVRLR